LIEKYNKLKKPPRSQDVESCSAMEEDIQKNKDTEPYRGPGQKPVYDFLRAISTIAPEFYLLDDENTRYSRGFIC
jgi:hypothetical protein